MRLEIEILNGNRRGTTISLELNKQVPGEMPYLLETEPVSFTFITEEPWQRVALILESTTIELFPVGSAIASEYRFHAHPKYRKEGGLEALFYNYFGVAVFTVDISKDGSSHVIEIGEIEILARKASVDQVEKMVSFILKEGESELLRSLGATRRDASPDNEGETPQRLVEHLESNLALLDELSPYLLQSPLKTLTTELRILPYEQNIEVQDQGLSWVLENISVLQPCDDIDLALFEHQFEHYSVREIQTSVQSETTDIYENRILHGYLENLLEFAQEIISGFSRSDSTRSLNTHEGYISFFAALQLWQKRESTIYIQRVILLQERLRRLTTLFRRKVPVRNALEELPRFTPKVRANRYYAELFQSIHQWYTCSSVNWRARQFLMAIKSIPKLFEIYALMRVKSWCHSNGKKALDAPSVIWRGHIGRSQILLHYEPIYWMVGHVKGSGDIVNTEIRNHLSAQTDKLGKKRFGDREHRSPDIVLEIQDDAGRISLVVLDAKYTTAELAFKRDLPECALKYALGLAHPNSQQLVAAMIILFPNEAQLYMDYRAKPFDAFGEFSQFPVLGVQGLGLRDEQSEEGMDRVLTKLVVQ